MGKTLSKAGMRVNTRRQRSQVVSRHQDRLISQTTGILTSASGGVVPRVLEMDRTILSLKLQKDELDVYRNRVEALLEKEMDILKKLLQDGKVYSAQLLLKKRRFQEYLLNESQKELNEILSHATASNPLKFKSVKIEAENCINKNIEAIKRIQMLVNLEDIERILEEGQIGQGKQDEVSKVLLIATTGERKTLESGLEAELNYIQASINEKEDKVKSTEDEGGVPAVNAQEANLIEFEEYVNEKADSNTEEIEDAFVTNNQLFPETASDSLVVSSAAEETEGVDGDDEKSGGSSGHTSDTVALERSNEEVSPKLIPAVPDDSVADEVGNKPAELPEPETSWMS